VDRETDIATRAHPQAIRDYLTRSSWLRVSEGVAGTLWEDPASGATLAIPYEAGEFSTSEWLSLRPPEVVD
jgi:hypothetical protein